MNKVMHHAPISPNTANTIENGAKNAVRHARQLDQFYTKSHVARRCIDIALPAFAHIQSSCVFIEPSAGQGAFLDALPKPAIGLDIAPPPMRTDIIKHDFLSWQPIDRTKSYVVIGNPPFGKNASLALKFLRHSASFADYVAFILPRTFEKASFQAKLDGHLRLLSQHSMDTDVFLFNEAPYSVPVVFQIWERCAAMTAREKLPTHHPDFEFVTRPSDADFAFQRVGARAGLVSHEGLKKSPQSHYFIKARDEGAALMQRLESIDWTPIKSRTAGNPSIGKAELIGAYQRSTS